MTVALQPSRPVSVGRLVRAVMLLAILIAGLLSCAGPAQAAVRSGAVNDGLDRQSTTPSFEPQAPRQEVLGAAVDYDDAGSVTVTVAFNRGRGEGEPLGAYVRLLGPESCADPEQRTDSERYAYGRPSPDDPAQVLGVSMPAPITPDDPNAPPPSSARLSGSQGELYAPTAFSPDGRSMTVTFSHQLLARHPFRCVLGYSGGDLFEFYFRGMERQKLSPATAAAFLTADLARRFPAQWPTRKRWMACPKEEFAKAYTDDDGQTSPPWQLCEFRFAVGNGVFRHGVVRLEERVESLHTEYFSVGQRFSQKLRTCRIRRHLRTFTPRILNRSLRASGYVGCSDNSASLIRDLHGLRPGVRTVAFHGTNRAGFEDAVRFRCRLTGRSGGRRTATCANRLGDRFVYRFTVARRAAVRR